MEMTLAKYDRIALAERRRRYVINNFSFGSGCRCCYDPKLDGGEYVALTEARLQAKEKEEDEEYQNKLEKDELQPTQHSKQQDHNNNDGDDDDDEYDYLLEEIDIQDDGIQKMEQERKAEMYLTALTLESAIHHGFGVHRQIHPQYILRATGLGISNTNTTKTATILPPPAVVLHLFEETSILSASLDLYLEQMASQYKGTKFIRCNGRLALIWNPTLVSILFPQLSHTTTSVDIHTWMDRYVPCLFAIQKGQVVSSCYHLDEFGNIKQGGVDPLKVENWLYHTGVLFTQHTLSLEDFCRYRPEEEALHETMIRAQIGRGKENDDEEEEEIHHCGILGCQKKFVHEHIGLKTEEQKGLLISEDQTLGMDK